MKSVIVWAVEHEQRTGEGGSTVDKRKRYEIICPYCGNVQYACKSILHEMGIEDGGRGKCLDCGKHMRLIFDGESQNMRSEKWQMEGE